MKKEFYLKSETDIADLQDFINTNKGKLFEITKEGDSITVDTYENQ